LDQGKGAPAEPRLEAVTAELLPKGASGIELSRLEDGWLPLLDAFPWGRSQAEALKLRGCILFEIGARLLGGEPRLAQPAGELWSLIDGAQHCSDPASCDYLLDTACSMSAGSKVPAKLRPLTIITAVAVANVRDPSNGLARVMTAARHRLTGHIPQLQLT
jgi:phytoene synthase